MYRHKHTFVYCVVDGKNVRLPTSKLAIDAKITYGSLYFTQFVWRDRIFEIDLWIRSTQTVHSQNVYRIREIAIFF